MDGKKKCCFACLQIVVSPIILIFCKWLSPTQLNVNSSLFSIRNGTYFFERLGGCLDVFSPSTCLCCLPKDTSDFGLRVRLQGRRGGVIEDRHRCESSRQHGSRCISLRSPQQQARAHCNDQKSPWQGQQRSDWEKPAWLFLWWTQEKVPSCSTLA